MPYRVQLPRGTREGHTPAGGSLYSKQPVPAVLRPALDDRLVAQLLGLPLDRFEQEGCPLEVLVPWLPVTLWFVPAEADAKTLAREGVSRGRIWTAGELIDFLAIPGLTPDQVKTVALAKAALNGEVAEVRPRMEGAS